MVGVVKGVRRLLSAHAHMRGQSGYGLAKPHSYCLASLPGASMHLDAALEAVGQEQQQHQANTQHSANTQPIHATTALRTALEAVG